MVFCSFQKIEPVVITWANGNAHSSVHNHCILEQLKHIAVIQTRSQIEDQKSHPHPVISKAIHKNEKRCSRAINQIEILLERLQIICFLWWAFKAVSQSP